MTLVSLRMLRVPFAAACAALGGAGLLASFVVLGERVPASAEAATANAAPTAQSPTDMDTAFCHTSSNGAARTSSMTRLAASMTEVPQAEMQAASSAPAFADTDPPLWDGLGSVSYQITTSKEAAPRSSRNQSV